MKDAPPLVVIIELFGGLLPATAALHMCGIPAITYYSEIASDPLEIAATHWPSAKPLGDIRFLNMDVLRHIVQQHTGALFWLTGGIPRKDISNLSNEGLHGLYTKAAVILKFLQSVCDNVVFTFECKMLETDECRMLSETFRVEPVDSAGVFNGMEIRFT